MNWIRYSLIAVIFVLAYLLFLQYAKFQARNAPKLTEEAPLVMPSLESTVATPTPNPTDSAGALPQVKAENDHSEVKAASTTTVLAPKLIHVKTDTLNLYIDTHGGDIVKLSLPKYLASLNNDKIGFTLMNRSESETYVAQSGLLGPQGTDTESWRPTFQSDDTNYELGDKSDLNVDLHLVQNGVKITKRFHFDKNSYLIHIEYLIDNTSDKPWQAAIYGQIRRNDFQVPTDIGIGIKPFLGAAITTPDENYKKFHFKDIEKETEKNKGYSLDNKGGWVALVQHYFVGAWIPNPDSKNHFQIKKFHDLYILGFNGQLQSIAAGQNGRLTTSFYAGPKIIKSLEKIAPHFDLTIDFGHLWFFSKPMFHFLDFIHRFVGNWGFSIMLLTCSIKLLFFYPSAISYRSMAKMRRLQPQMTELKERCGDDKQKYSMEVMKLYKKEKVSPFGGCLPIMLQMPVFLSLYYMLMETVELRHAPFILWIHDLSAKDPFFILPLIMGSTMFIQQKLNPAPPDPMQAKVMQFMPVVFTMLFLWFPSGLVLYWVVNNSLSILQQYIITRSINKAA